MSDTDETGEQAFQKLVIWVNTNLQEIEKGNLPDPDNSVNAFTALATMLGCVEVFMSIDRRREMALLVEKALTP